MNIDQLIRSNRLPKKQRGQLIETESTFYVRYYTDAPANDKDAVRHGVEVGTMIRKQTCEKLCDRSETYRTKQDVLPLMDAAMARVNGGIAMLSGRASLSDYFDTVYLPWAQKNKAAATADGYRKLWEKNLKPFIGKIALADLTTVQVTRLLTKHAEKMGRATLTHIKWGLSGIYEHAIANGVVSKNPATKAKWMIAVEAPEKQARYTLEQVIAMLRILEPVDLRGAVAVALAYFAALRPAEIRGLQWDDIEADVLHVRRKVWRKETGKLKTDRSAGRVPLIQPLRSLLEKLKAQSTGKFILENGAGHSLNLDSVSTRVIAPAMEKAAIEWRGFYPCRRGISTAVVNNSRNVLDGSGLLRNSPATNLKHYTDAQWDSIVAAMRTVEEQALELKAKSEKETVQ